MYFYVLTSVYSSKYIFAKRFSQYGCVWWSWQSCRSCMTCHNLHNFTLFSLCNIPNCWVTCTHTLLSAVTTIKCTEAKKWSSLQCTKVGIDRLKSQQRQMKYAQFLSYKLYCLLLHMQICQLCPACATVNKNHCSWNCDKMVHILKLEVRKQRNYCTVKLFPSTSFSELFTNHLIVLFT